jgi:hypothetical protein
VRDDPRSDGRPSARRIKCVSDRGKRPALHMQCLHAGAKRHAAQAPQNKTFFMRENLPCTLFHVFIVSLDLEMYSRDGGKFSISYMF